MGVPTRGPSLELGLLEGFWSFQGYFSSFYGYFELICALFLYLIFHSCGAHVGVAHKRTEKRPLIPSASLHSIERERESLYLRLVLQKQNSARTQICVVILGGIMAVNESYNEDMENSNADGAEPTADDMNTGSSGPPKENLKKCEGADEKNDELLSNDHVPFNKFDQDSSAVEENSNVDEDEKITLPSLELEDSTKFTKSDTAASEPKNNNMDKDLTTPTHPKINEDLIKELSSALDSCEQMRRVNLEVEYSSVSPALPQSMAVNHEKCTYCQRDAWQQFLLNPTPHHDENGDDNAKRGGGGGGINIGSLKLDGSRIKNLDGRRIRRFRSNVGNFFAKQPSNDVKQDSVRKEDDDLFFKAADSMDAAPKDVSMSAGGSHRSDSNEGENSNNINKGTPGGNSNNITDKKPAPRKTFLQKPPPPCLTCGHPVCKKHQSSTFSTSSIRICQPCAQLFELDFLVDVITTTASNTAECRTKVNQMVDCYDRAKLLLLFTSQYTDQVAEALEHSTIRSNKIGVGSSATGMVSGMAGVVGCGALLFPPAAAVGIPLLISSLVFGGAATAAQTGDAAVQYFSEPNKLADKMVTLHGMMLSLLRISEVLSYGLLKDHDDLEGDADDKRKALAEEINALLEKHGVATKGVKGLRTAVVGGTVAAEVAAAGAEISATSIATTSATVAGRSSRFFGRVGTTAASSARFIPIAGGLLSAACIVVEGKELKKTVSKINEGNPCAKAEQIRSIRDELDKFPASSVIADECRRVFEIAEKECAFF